MGQGKWTKRLLSLGLASILLAAATAGTSEPTSVRPMVEFRDYVAELVRQRLPNDNLKMTDPGQMILNGPDTADKPLTINVDNFYGRYINGVQTFESAANELVKGVLDVVPASMQPVANKESLVVIIRPANYLREMEKQGKETFLKRELSTGLNYIVATDGKTNLAVLPKAQLARLGLSDDQIWELAIANIPSRIGALEVKQMDRSVWTVTSPNDLGLSVMLDDGFWAHPTMVLKGKPAVAAIQKNLLVVVDTADEEDLAKVKTWLAELRSDPDTMSTDLLIRAGSVWSELKE